MDDRSGNRGSREHRASMRTSVRLSAIGDEGSNDLFVAVSPSPDSNDPAPPNGNPLVPQNPPLLDNGRLQRPRSAHSRPSSIAKPHVHSAHPSRNDGTPPEAGLGGSPSIPVQAEAPYEGPSNPSHPYQMYPQRAMSISTISTPTPGPDGSHPAPGGPAHPYALYPQSTPADDLSQPESIPVGFSGLTNAYTQRAGAAGDGVGSFVGSLAPAEELPPYTRYPDNAPGAKAVGSQPSTNTEDPSTREGQSGSRSYTTPASDISDIPGAGGIGLATRDPEFASTSSQLESPRLSTRSFTSDDSQHEINTAARAVVNEKRPAARNSWQQKATKKLWGIIPYWAVGLLGIALILVGVILGAVIGTFLSKRDKSPRGGKPDRPPVGDFNATQEVILLESVPPDLPDLETGEWGLLPLIVSQGPGTCFEIPEQSQAWTCNTPFNMYWVDVQRTDGEPPTSAYQLKFTTSKNSTAFTKYAWGTRAPAIPEHETLRLVSDPYQPGLGPAWWVRMEYNKTVVLPEDRLSRSSEAIKRARRDLPSDEVSAADEEDVPDEEDAPGEEDGGQEDSGKDDDSKDKMGQPFPLPGAKEGDKPWICTWPDTVLELFVYPGQNNTFNTHAATASFSGWPAFPTPTESSTSTGELPTGEATPTLPPGIPTETPSVDAPGGKSDWPKFPPLPPPYPKIIRISERRVDGLANAVAFCEQVEIIDGGKDHRPALDDKGQPIRVAVPEQTRGLRPLDSRDLWVDAHELVSRDKPPGECGCVWMVE